MDLQRATEIVRAAKYRQLALYRPYPKQRFFHALGKDKRERVLMAGNQQGKSWSGGAEVAFHATGEYPEWWQGKRIPYAPTIWVAGITNEQTRDNAQRVLLGPESVAGAPEGTGMLPGHRILDFTYAKGIANFLDTVVVQHVSGDKTILKFKSYEQGRKKWQGPPIDVIWCDEEPPADLYGEALARTTKTAGMIFITFTPLLGMTDVVGWFFPRPKEVHRALVQMTIEDAEHIPAERRAEEIAKYPEHEREARVNGIPMLGQGLVFPIAESLIRCDPMPIPDSFRRIAGLDFGWDHPAAVAWLAWDTERDIVYVYDAWRGEKTLRKDIASTILLRPEGAWMPIAWPHDGHQHDKGTGVKEAEAYARLGVKMLSEHAAQANGSIGTETGVADLLDRMRTGRFKVFSTLDVWFDEFRLYHRKEGKIVRLRDDVLSATRYAHTCMEVSSRSKAEGRVFPSHVGMDYEPMLESAPLDVSQLRVPWPN